MKNIELFIAFFVLFLCCEVTQSYRFKRQEDIINTNSNNSKNEIQKNLNVNTITDPNGKLPPHIFIFKQLYMIK